MTVPPPEDGPNPSDLFRSATSPTGPPPPPPAPPIYRPIRRSVPVLLVIGLIWVAFVVSLVPLLFVWVAVGDDSKGYGLAWPITAISAALLLVGALLTVWSGRRTQR